MRRNLVRRLAVPLALAMLGAVAANADIVPVGFLTWDLNFPGNAGEFDLVNLTGPNSNVDFPILTTLNLSNLNLIVDFTDGSTQTFGPASGYFSLDSDGESLDGSSIPIGGVNPLPEAATLTGLFGPTTISLNTGGGPVLIDPEFTVGFSDTPNLMDQDFGIIYATTTTATPEPDVRIPLVLGLAALVAARSRRVASALRSIFRVGAL